MPKPWRTRSAGTPPAEDVTGIWTPCCAGGARRGRYLGPILNHLGNTSARHPKFLLEKGEEGHQAVLRRGQKQGRKALQEKREEGVVDPDHRAEVSVDLPDLRSVEMSINCPVARGLESASIFGASAAPGGLPSGALSVHVGMPNEVAAKAVLPLWAATAGRQSGTGAQLPMQQQRAERNAPDGLTEKRPGLSHLIDRGLQE